VVVGKALSKDDEQQVLLIESPRAQLRPPARCLINATNDQEAIEFYLRQHARSASTRVAYAREIGRFWNWFKRQGFAQLDDVGADDVGRYVEELKTGLVGTPKSLSTMAAVESKPKVNKPLSEGSINYSIGILRSMCNYLLKVRYLTGNVFEAVVNLPEVDRGEKVERYLKPADWAEVQETIDLMPRDTRLKLATYHQARWVVCLAVMTGLRRAEIAAGYMAAFAPEEGRWWLNVLGKGKKQRKVPVADALMTELRVYRSWIRSLEGMGSMSDLPGQIGDVHGLPLVLRVDGSKQPLEIRRIWGIVHNVMEATSRRLEQGAEPARAAVIKKVSTHWLRHTAVTTVANLVDVQTAQGYARHSDVRTTMNYVHAEAEQLHDKVSEAMDKSGLFKRVVESDSGESA